MKQGPDEQLNTPLEDALLNLSQEEPPADLQGACIAALHEVSARPRAHWEPWRQLVAAAAVLVMIVGTGNLFLTRNVREKARYVPPTEFNNFAGRMEAPMAPSAPGAPPSAEAVSESWKARRSSSTGRSSRRLAVGGNPFDTASPPQSPAAQTAQQGDLNSPGQRPWDDQSDTRRKITERTVELETPRVEETYKQVVGVIEKAGGYVLQEDLVVRRRGHSQARLQARIPIAPFDGVISQVRELGRLVLMTGQTHGETERYQFDAAGIRELGAREEELVLRYAGEKDRQKKAQLARELASVRGQLSGAKQALKSLHKATNYAQLTLTINESRGLRAVVKNAAEAALPLAFSLSLIAVPLLILALIWKRRS
ncbi:MAG: DUF4349 domain-containing protein [Armatimonadota bacterium]